jgi:hypothetical protein
MVPVGPIEQVSRQELLKEKENCSYQANRGGTHHENNGGVNSRYPPNTEYAGYNKGTSDN